MIPAPSGAVPLRLRHVDSLRAVAAGLVMWLHLAQTLGPVSARGPALLGFLQTVPYLVNVGRMGVTIFFAVSGFVICRSFGGPREGGAGRFLIKRFCRLYPAYWVSMLGGVPVFLLMGNVLNWRILAANATMAPAALFHQPPLLGVYWTLEIELGFYALCLGLYLCRGLDRPLILAGCSLLLAFLPRLLHGIDVHAGTHLGLKPGQPTVVLGLAVMFWGSVFRLVYDATGGFRRGGRTHYRSMALLAALTLALIDVPDPNVKWFLLGRWHGVPPAHLNVVCSLGIFTLWIACLRVENVLLTFAGVISYSVYLFHPVAAESVVRLLAACGWMPPFWVSFLMGVALSTALAAGVYRWVERPAIALGKRWANPPERNSTK